MTCAPCSGDTLEMVLLNAQGQTHPRIAQLVRRNPDTVGRVLKRYLAGVGPTRCRTRPTPTSHPSTRPSGKDELVRVADLAPIKVGVDSALWTCRLLADYLAETTGHRAGIETVRDRPHRAGLVCKRPAGS